MSIPTPVSLGLFLGGQVLSGLEQRSVAKAQASAANQSAAFQQKQIALDIDREKTQQALEAAERERRLKIALAAQQARSAGIIELSSGTPQTLMNETIATSKREQDLANLDSAQRIANLNVESVQTEIGRQSRVSSYKSQGRQALFDTATSVGSFAYNNKDLA